MSKKVTIVMPAYFAEKTLKKTYETIPKGSYDEIILVDDASTDNTAQIARELGFHVVVHEKNKGYGANQKTCYNTALERGADIVVMLHPDFQYDPSLVPDFVKPIMEGKADVVYGSRMKLRGQAKKGGMPLWKRLGNKALTTYYNVLVGTNITDAATGYIAYSRKVLQTIPYMLNDDGFCFDEESMIQCAAHRFKMCEVPIPTKYEDDSSSIGVMKALRYGFILSYKVLQYKLTQYKLAEFKQFKTNF